MEAKLATKSKRKELLAKRDPLAAEGLEGEEAPEQAGETYSIGTDSEGEHQEPGDDDLGDVDYLDQDQLDDDEEHLEGEDGESDEFEDFEEGLEDEAGEEVDENYMQKFETNFV
jgi:hypothetical protein